MLCLLSWWVYGGQATSNSLEVHRARVGGLQALPALKLNLGLFNCSTEDFFFLILLLFSSIVCDSELA